MTAQGGVNVSSPEFECAIVVVSYNSARHIERLLDSVPEAAGALRIQCIVVDNDSTDETMSIL